MLNTQSQDTSFVYIYKIQLYEVIFKYHIRII